MRPSGIPLYTSSGSVAVLSPGYVVHILDEREYRVLRINPHSSTVVLRLLTNGALCVPPHHFVYFLFQPAIHLSLWTNLLEIVCEIPPPPVLPDNLDAQIERNLDADAYTSFKHQEFDSVDRLSQGFEEAKLAANSAFKELCEEINRRNSLKDQITDLKTRIAALTSEYGSLLKRTLELTEDISSLKSITANSRH